MVRIGLHCGLGVYLTTCPRLVVQACCADQKCWGFIARNFQLQCGKSLASTYLLAVRRVASTAHSNVKVPSYRNLSIQHFCTIDRRVPEGDESVREVRISCPDATGLGCDIARMLLDFGLRILTGDLSTDGTWCYLVFVVRVSVQTVNPGMNCRSSWSPDLLLSVYCFVDCAAAD